MGATKKKPDPFTPYTRIVVCGVLVILVLCTVAIIIYVSTLGMATWDAIADKNNREISLAAVEGGFVAVVAAIFGILITGVFVFMTFRIDRGAIVESRSEARSVAKEYMEEIEAKAKRAVRDARKTLKRAKETQEAMSNDVVEKRVADAIESEKADFRKYALDAAQASTRLATAGFRRALVNANPQINTQVPDIERNELESEIDNLNNDND